MIVFQIIKLFECRVVDLIQKKFFFCLKYWKLYFPKTKGDMETNFKRDAEINLVNHLMNNYN